MCSASQQRDCSCGIIICGLDSVYIHPVATTLQVVLKAINKRKHIYAVNLSCSYAVLKARDKLKRVAMGNYIKCANTCTCRHWADTFTVFLVNQYKVCESVLYVSPQRFYEGGGPQGRGAGCKIWMRRSMMLYQRQKRRSSWRDTEWSWDKWNSGISW